MLFDMKTIDRRALYQDFLKAFPLESLKDMPLEKYTNLNKDDSFCYWLEFKTRYLASIKGGTSYKFGIYRFNKKPKESDTLVQSDDKYAWYNKFQKQTAKEAYEVVRNSIVSIAEHAQKGEFESIDKINTLGDVVKWKIAFIYSNESLIPIFNRKMLNIVSTELGMKEPANKSIPYIQRFLMLKKNDTDLFVFYQELLDILKKKKIEDSDEDDNDVNLDDDRDVKYWMYAPGENASEWAECQEKEFMCIDWNEMGDLNQYNSIDDIQRKLQEIYKKPDSSFKNDRLALWDFCHVMKPGDIVFAKQGLSKILGRGVVTDEYVYDSSRQTYPNIRKVHWTNIGSWEAPEHSIPMKTLTDYTDYTEDLAIIKN